MNAASEKDEIIKSPQAIEAMRRAGRVAADAMAALEPLIKPGIATRELDRFAEEYIRRQGAIPVFKGYRGYPASICVSINREVVHGIPSERRLKKGDIVSIDLGTEKDGFCGDVAATFPVGEVSEGSLKLLRVTREALELGIAQTRAGGRLHDISNAIQRHVESNGFSVVRDYVGHGIGRKMHEEPQVPNFGQAGTGIRLKPGMVLAIEPMVNEGTWSVSLEDDNWTVVTSDGRNSAHFEHVVAVTESGPEILTLPTEGAYA